MATISDLYQNLFGKNHITDGSVIDMAEHGRVGGVSTGQGYKAVGILNASGSLVSDFGGTVSVSLASLSVSVDFSSFPSISGRVLADQGSAGTTAWLMTLATLSVVTQPGAGALATITSIQGDPGAIPWLMTMGTLSVVTQAGAGALATVTAHQGLAGATPWLVTQATLPVSFAPPSVAGGSLTAYQGTSPWVISGAVTNANLDVTLGSRLASGSTLPVTGNVGQLGTWTVQPGNTPNTTAWLVTMGTLPVAASFSGSIPVAGGSLTSYQGGLWNVLASLSGTPSVLNAGGSLTTYQGSAPWTVMATISNNVNTLNAGGSLTAYQGSAPWNVLASISGSPIIINGGGSLSAYNVGGSLSAYNVGGSLSAYAVGGSLTAFQGGSPWNMSNAGGSMTVYQGSAPWSMANAGGSLTVYPGNVPNTIAWLVTMATLPIVYGTTGNGNATGALRVTVANNSTGILGSVTAITNALPAGTNSIGSVMATISNNVNTLNAGGSLTAFQGGLWNVLASISGIPSVLAAGGSLTAFKNNAANAMTTMVSASATAVTLLAANSARKGASFYNNSSAILYLRNGAGASTSAFKVAMAASSYFEEPADYSGIVTGTWASAAGSVAVTEES